jgi:ParB family chromosome partitioning protein
MALGRGLDSLIPKKTRTVDYSTQPGRVASVDDYTSSDQGLRILEIAPDQIQVNPHQPRKSFHSAELENLMNSIKAHGIMLPLVVTKNEDGTYELIAGERRLRAAKALDMPKVPVLVRSAKEQEKLELALIENVQRKNLNVLEEAIAYQRLVDEFDQTQEQVAKQVGKSRSAVANILRINSLPQEVKQAIIDEKITEGHARALASLESISAQLQLLKKIIDNSLTVRDAEHQAQGMKQFKSKSFDPVLMDLEEKMRHALGLKVSIKKRGGKGTVTINFESPEDFDSLLRKINGNN